METFGVTIKEKTYRVIRKGTDNCTFTVFNHAICYIIQKNNFGIWETVEHRFGADNLPIDEIYNAIDMHYKQGSNVYIQEHI